MSGNMLWLVPLALAGAAILRAATPILFAALGGLVSDLAGSINVALEGLMLIAAFFGVMAAVYLQRWLPGLAPWCYPWFGCLAGLGAALLLTVVLAVFHLELGADPIVAGIALNILAAALTVFLLATLVGDKGSTAGLNSPALPALAVPGFDDFPALNTLVNGENGSGHNILIYAALAETVLLALFLRRTRWGTWIRAVGEHREAALAAGIPVKRMQYLAFAISGVSAGLGGVYLSMGYLTLFQADMSAGRGFLALAAIFLGRRTPFGTATAALLFGATAVLATRLGGWNMPTELAYMVSPAVTILALVVAGRAGKRTRTMDKV